MVGAGPVGLSLALGLSRAGRSVLVLEKEPSTADHSRAPAIWPRTQEILTGLGVIRRFIERGLVHRELRLWDADRNRVLIRFPFGELADETDHPQLLVLPQSVTERLLHEAVRQEAAAEVRFSTEVVGVDPTDGQGRSVRVVCRGTGGEETVRAAYVAGCDGAHSTVRESIGASFEGTTYGTRAALADVTLEEGRGRRSPRMTTRDRLALGIRIDAGPPGDGGLWRLILPFEPGDDLALEERVGRAVGRLFSTDGYATVWKSEFRLHRRVASRFVAGRVVLAGDAAHLNSPVGGQGMNAGIRDAEVLVPALLRALDRDEPEALEAYGRRRRRAVSEGVNRFTDWLTRLLLLGRGRFVRPVFRLTSLALRIRPLRRRLLRRLAMLEG